MLPFTIQLEVDPEDERQELIAIDGNTSGLVRNWRELEAFVTFCVDRRRVRECASVEADKRHDD